MIREMMIRIADALPEDLILEMLKSAISIYETDKTPENKRALHHAISMVILKLMATDQGVEKLSGELEHLHRLSNVFKDTN